MGEQQQEACAADQVMGAPQGGEPAEQLIEARDAETDDGRHQEETETGDPREAAQAVECRGRAIETATRQCNPGDQGGKQAEQPQQGVGHPCFHVFIQ